MMRKYTFRFAVVVLVIFFTAQSVSAATLLIPVGEVIGLQLKDDRVTIEAFDNTLGAAAQAAGLEVGDEILTIDDKPIHCAEDIRQALKQSDGSVHLQIRRGRQTRQLEIVPSVTKDGPKLGVLLKEGITGIGTVTYYDPQSGSFAALGHGVNDPDGELVEMTQGIAYSARVDTVRKGRVGEPGQLMGSVTDPEPLAQLSKNMPQGVFGNGDLLFRGDPLPAASVEEIRTGPATIRSTVQNGTVREYSVEILKIYPGSGADGRNMVLRITDPALLEATGGIVQGMSGSPIIQDGKLIGAVTHVLVNDPTTGYGIFIENMLDAAA